MTKIKTLEDLDKFAGEFLNKHPKGAIVGLSGTLGAGKTTFVRAVVKRLSPRERVMSPTYVLHQVYPTNPPIHHMDLYRLENVDQSSLLELQYFASLEEVRRKKGFLFVEWPEKCVDVKLLGLDVYLRFDITGTERDVSALHVS